eukprot:TRINITY_DN2273_c0_g1_i1.p1 TRINITY_DN2273_c0_g1~~TRINITY_DN2273_c0_g1_i1.p1  ORF type:complete len:155 (-),score=35.15 TRINITY_DN2273_c0_g1_i1:603-1067(-)
MERSEETNINSSIRWDTSYLLSIPGIFKLSQLALNGLGFFSIIFAGAYQALPAAEWFTFVAATGFLINIIFILLYCFHCIEKFHVIPWNMIEAGYAGLWGFFYLAAAIALASYASIVAAFGAAAFFGFAAMVAYVADALFKFQAFRSRTMPQYS